MTVSLILVTWRSSAVAGGAMAAFRREVAALGLPGEVIVVDHSEDPAEAESLRALAPEVLRICPNRGYAAGLNTGIGIASGDLLLLANPDVELAPGALGALLGALDRGWDVVGPLFHLGPWLFPPADLQGPGAELLRWRATRTRASLGRHLSREIGRWQGLWTAREPVPMPVLSGALLAVRKETAAAIGPWDEGYFLYFEETDWLRRASRRGWKVAQVPAGRARHAWGHAARPEEQEGTFARSRRRYYGHYFGALGRLITALPKASPPLHPPLPTPEELPADATTRFLVSPSPWGFPAALGEGVGRDQLHQALRAFHQASGHGGHWTVVAWHPDRPAGDALSLYSETGA